MDALLRLVRILHELDFGLPRYCNQEVHSIILTQHCKESTAFMHIHLASNHSDDIYSFMITG